MGDSYSKLFVDDSMYDSDEETDEEIESIKEEVENKVPFKGPTSDSIVNSVISEFISRSNVGLEKYGTTLDRGDLSLMDWVQHAQEEMMDGILYLEKIKKLERHRIEMNSYL